MIEPELLTQNPIKRKKLGKPKLKEISLDASDFKIDRSQNLSIQDCYMVNRARRTSDGKTYITKCYKMDKVKELGYGKQLETEINLLYSLRNCSLFANLVGIVEDGSNKILVF